MQSPDLFRQLIGEKGQSTAVAQAAFTERGIRLSAKTVAGLRSGRWDQHYGNSTSARLNYYLFREENDPTAKIEYYLNIGQVGVDLRRPQMEMPHRFSSKGLSIDRANLLGLDQTEVSARLRAIRVDVTASDRIVPDREVKTMFANTVDQYVEVHKKPKSEANKRVSDISRMWDGSDVGNFYRILYVQTNGAGIGVWATYETEFIRDYYQMLSEEQPGLSPFDRFALEALMRADSYRYAEDLRRWTGIPIEESVIGSHVAVLTTPQNPTV